MQRSTFVLAAAVILAAVLIVYDRPSPPPPAAAGPTAGGALPDGHPPLDAAPQPAGALGGPSATVLETMNSAGYTYARVETVGDDGQPVEVWAAGPVTTLEVGQTVSLDGAMGMQNFRAESLDRTFDAILFVNRFGTGAAGGQASAAPGGAAAPPSSFSGEAAPIAGGLVLEAIQGAGYTYVHVEDDGVRLWVAGEQIDVEAGQAVTWDGGAVMRDFESPTLQRTFDRLLFADGLRVRQ